MEHLEIELKFLVTGFESLRNRLQALGAGCVEPNTLEYNVRYETPDERLRETNCLLRLRKAQDTILTFKSPPALADNRFKTYREREVKVDDFNTMDAILRSLGFLRRQVYEKWRETWQMDATTFCLDTMPYGHFLEIEGPPDAITAMVDALSLTWRQRILHSYLGIFELLQKEEGLRFKDLTFDNFKPIDIDMDRYRPLIEVGDEDAP